MPWPKIDFNPKITIVPIVSPCVWAIVLVCMLVGSRMLRITDAHILAGKNPVSDISLQNVLQCCFRITDAHILAGRNPY